MSTSTSTSCSIPVKILSSSPFNLSWGSSVFAKIIATNSYGDSITSSIGSGAIIATVPDAPIDL